MKTKAEDPHLRRPQRLQLSHNSSPMNKSEQRRRGVDRDKGTLVREGGCGLPSIKEEMMVSAVREKDPRVWAPAHHEDCGKGQVGSGQPFLSTGKGDRVPSPDGTEDRAQ